MNRGSQHFTGGRDKNHLKEKEMQEGKVVVWGGLTNSWEKKREAKDKGEGERYTQIQSTRYFPKVEGDFQIIKVQEASSPQNEKKPSPMYTKEDAKNPAEM